MFILRPSAILFIDSSNFYHSLKEHNDLPFDAEGFEELFKALSEKFKVLKVYFYDAMKDSSKDPKGYSGQQRFHERLKKVKPDIVIKTRKLRYLVNITDKQISESAKTAGIIDACRDKLKKFLIELGVFRYTKEKGVDVLLVVDAVEEARAKTADTIIFLTGDADFVPAVHLIREYGVKTVNLHPYLGSSNELRNACNTHILISFDDRGKIVLK